MRLRILLTLALLCLSAQLTFGQSLSTSPNPSNVGDPVTLTATNVPPDLTVTFYDGGSGGTAIGSGTASAGGGSTGSVSIVVSTLTVGSHQLVACFQFSSVPSCSSPVTQVVNPGTGTGNPGPPPPGPTTLTLTSSANPSLLCQSVTLTASLSRTDAPGNIAFFDGTATLATVPVANAAASYTTSSLALGNRQIQARYVPDPGSGFGASSAGLVQVVNSAVTVTLSSAPNPSNFGQTVNITAVVAPVACQAAPAPTAPPAGSVTFFDGTSQIGQSNVTSATATLSTSTLSVGSHGLTAQFTGFANYLPNTSNTVTQVVNSVKTNTTTTLTASVNPIILTQSLTLTAVVSPPGATGQVQFKDGGATIGTSTLAGGAASLTISNLTVGVHPLVAVYLGDANYNTSTSNTVGETVTTPTSSTTLSVSPNPANLGQAVTLSATVTPGTATGSVQFQDGGTVLGQSTLTAGTAILSVSTFTAGSHSLTAHYLGDTVYPPSTSNSVSLTVGIKTNTTTSLATSSNPVTTGQSLTLTATVSPAGATGQVQFSDGGTFLGAVALANGIASFTTSTLSPGTHALLANYLGDANYNPSTSPPVNQIVITPVSQPTTTTLSVTPNPAAPGQAVTFSSVVTPVTGTGPATGTVTFRDNGAILATAQLLNGTALFTTNSLLAGNHTIVAVYSGNTTFNSSSSSPVTLVVSAPLTQTTLVVSPNPSTYGQTVFLTATVAAATGGGVPTGTITFADGGTTLGVVALSGGGATFSTSTFSVGNHSLIATYSGDGTFAAGSSLPLSLQVNPSSTTTSLSAAPTSIGSGQPVLLTARVSPATATGTVTFMDGGSAVGGPVPVVAGNASTTTSSLPNGNHSITAVYSGDANFLPSTSPAVTVSVGLTTTATTLSRIANVVHLGSVRRLSPRPSRSRSPRWAPCRPSLLGP